MKNFVVLLTGSMALSGIALAQQPQAPPASSQPAAAAAQPAPPAIYRLDGYQGTSVFSIGEPKLEGDFYVFTILPEKTVERLPKSKVKAVVKRTKDFDSETIYQVELLPSGTILMDDPPVKKGTVYTLKPWPKGALMSVKETDVKSVKKLTGMEAYKAEEIALGTKLMQHNPPAGAGHNPKANEPAPDANAQGKGQQQAPPSDDRNIGTTWAAPPPNATVSQPGDVPKAQQP